MTGPRSLQWGGGAVVALVLILVGTAIAMPRLVTISADPAGFGTSPSKPLAPECDAGVPADDADTRTFVNQQ